MAWSLAFIVLLNAYNFYYYALLHITITLRVAVFISEK